MGVGVKGTARASIFLVCLALFAWQAYEIVDEYCQKEIATKVGVLPIGPAASQFDLAFCLDPINTMNLFQHEGEEYNFNILNDVLALDEDVYLNSFDGLFKNLLVDARIRIKYIFDDDTNVQVNHSKAAPFYHPLYGSCAVVSAVAAGLAGRTVASVTADLDPAELDQVLTRERRQADEAERSPPSGNETAGAPYGSYQEAPPRLPTELCGPGSDGLASGFPGERCCPDGGANSTSTCCTGVGRDGSLCCCVKDQPEQSCECNLLESPGAPVGPGPPPPQLAPTHYDAPFDFATRRSELLAGSVSVYVFQRRQFHRTHAGISVDRGAADIASVHQDLVDKAEVSHYLEEPCGKDEDEDEDACLSACLVDRFAREAGCVHSRLKPLLGLAGGWGEAGRLRLCRGRDLAGLLANGTVPGRADAWGREIDPGLSLIKGIVSGFGGGGGERCGCPKPCVRRHFEVRRQKDYQHTSQEGLQAVLTVEQRYFHYRDGATFDAVKMVADLGGYLGLMLGYSAYSIADLVDFLWHLHSSTENKIDPS